MSLAAIAFDRTVLELKMYFRERESVFFSFLFPVLMLSLFAAVFGAAFREGGSEVGPAQFFLPGMVAGGVMLTSFQTLAMSVALERDDGTLKRLRSTPMPPVAYFLGKVGLVAVSSLGQLALLLTVARFVFDVPLPTTASAWMTFAWVFLLGVAGGTVLGIAYSSVASSARSAGAVVIGPLLVLQFISGVYFAYGDIPSWIQQVAALFPLKWVAQGMRSVFYPAGMETAEVAGSWEHPLTALVLAVWLVAGLVLGARTFTWFKRGTV